MYLSSWVASIKRVAQNDGVRWAAVLTCGAIILAVFFVSLVAQPPMSVLDGPAYHNMARDLVSELSFGSSGYPYPLYPIFLAVIYAAGGGFLTVFYVQGVLLALVAGLSYGLARQIAGHGAGVFAALLVIFDASLLGNVGLFATETLQTLLLLLAMIASLYAINQEKLRFHGLAGVLWGLLTLVKPVTLLLPAAFFLVYLLVERKRGWLVRWMVVVLAFALTLSPWLIRNQVSADISTVGPDYSYLLFHVLEEGESQRTLANMAPKIKAVIADAEERGIAVGSLQFELNTLRLLRERIAASPSDYLAFVWQTFSRFWIEPPASWPYAVYDGSTYYPRGFKQAPGYADYARLHAVLAVLGLLSLVLLFRAKPRAATLISMFLLYYAMLYTMTHFIPRYSAPILPLMFVGAAVFPVLAKDAIKGKFADFRILSNVILAALAVALVTSVSLHLLLQRPNEIVGGSFETDEAAAEWLFEQRIGQPFAPLVVDEFRARRGFRSAVLEIGLEEQDGDTRMLQRVPVWFGGKYRLTFSYLVLQETGSTPLYVEVREQSIFEEGWRRVLKEFQPIVTNTWMEQELEFLVSGEAQGITLIFGLAQHPGTVLIDNVRLELAAPFGEVVRRPYLLQDPDEVSPNDYLPLEKWVLTKPESYRELYLSNVGLAKSSGWKGDPGTLELMAYGAGAGVIVVWILVSAAFARLRVVQRVARTRLPDWALTTAMAALIIMQAATCYLLLFSHPA